ncbi:MAG: hypothetical protein AB7O26_01235 [Planctomycetaceae bacterium]
MSAKGRDDFPEVVKRTLGERAAYICSNPACRRPTIGPHSDPKLSLKTGEACHIASAAPGGPRFNSEQSSDERRSIENAIWLCTECSTRVDRDEVRFPAGDLLRWKSEHESWLINGGIVPSLPTLTLKTLNGLSIPDSPSVITAADYSEYREHSFSIENSSDVDIYSIEALVQLPEPILRSFGKHKEPGTHVAWQPKRMEMSAVVKGGGSVTRNRPPLPSAAYTLQIDCIRSKQCVELGFLTSNAIFPAHDFSPNTSPFAGSSEARNLLNFIDGTFRFEYQRAKLEKRFFAPLNFNNESRHISILEVRADFGDWQPVAISMFS